MVEPLHIFVSDVHLGINDDTAKAREARFLDFLRNLPKETAGLYLLGDIFDFWVEYRDVVPRGSVRVLGELAALSDRGVKIYFFTGNHDYWLTDYLRDEIGMEIIQEPLIVKEIEGKRVCIGHGDGLGCRNPFIRMLFSAIRNKWLVHLLKSIHPWPIFRWARKWSSVSRNPGNRSKYIFKGKDSDFYRYICEFGEAKGIDCYIFGHVHLQMEIEVESGGTLYLLGDWAEGASSLNLSGTNIGFGASPNMS